MVNFDEIKARLAEVAKKSKVSDEDNIRELGLDSLDICELLLEFEDKYHITFDDAALGNLNTVKDLLDAIAAQVK